MDETTRKLAGILAAKSLEHNPELILETYLFSASEMVALGAPSVPVKVQVSRQFSVEELRDDIMTGVAEYKSFLEGIPA